MNKSNLLEKEIKEDRSGNVLDFSVYFGLLTSTMVILKTSSAVFFKVPVILTAALGYTFFRVFPLWQKYHLAAECRQLGARYLKLYEDANLLRFQLAIKPECEIESVHKQHPKAL